MKNKTTIQITELSNEISMPVYMDKILLLRSARKVGDIETVNNTQLGRIKEHKSWNLLNYIVL